MPAEAGCGGFVGQSLWLGMGNLGVPGQERKKACEKVNKEAEMASTWTWRKRKDGWKRNQWNLGLQMDALMSGDAHVSKLCSTYYYTLRNIGRIRKWLTCDTAKVIIQGLVIARLDYCNILLVEISKKSTTQINVTSRLLHSRMFCCSHHAELVDLCKPKCME